MRPKADQNVGPGLNPNDLMTCPKPVGSGHIGSCSALACSLFVGTLILGLSEILAIH